MQFIPEIIVRDIPASDAIEAAVNKKIAKLAQLFDQIMTCHVTVEVPQKHQYKGKIYQVIINIGVPGKEIVVNRQFDEDVYVAIRDAFNAARRQLDAYARIERGETKTHETMQQGVIVALMRDEDYGFIETDDGQQYYFHANHLSNTDYEALKEGMAVEFISVTAGDGLQANHVVVKHEGEP